MVRPLRAGSRAPRTEIEACRAPRTLRPPKAQRPSAPRKPLLKVAGKPARLRRPCLPPRVATRSEGRTPTRSSRLRRAWDTPCTPRRKRRVRRTRAETAATPGTPGTTSRGTKVRRGPKGMAKPEARPGRPEPPGSVVVDGARRAAPPERPEFPAWPLPRQRPEPLRPKARLPCRGPTPKETTVPRAIARRGRGPRSTSGRSVLRTGSPARGLRSAWGTSSSGRSSRSPTTPSSSTSPGRRAASSTATR